MVSPTGLFLLLLTLATSSTANPAPAPCPPYSPVTRQYMKPLAESPRFRQILGHDPRFQLLFDLPPTSNVTTNATLADDFEECPTRYKNTEDGVDVLQPSVIRFQMDV